MQISGTDLQFSGISGIIETGWERSLLTLNAWKNLNSATQDRICRILTTALRRPPHASHNGDNATFSVPSFFGNPQKKIYEET